MSLYRTEYPRVANALMRVGFKARAVPNPYNEMRPLWVFEKTDALLEAVSLLQGEHKLLPRVRHDEQNEEDN